MSAHIPALRGAFLYLSRQKQLRGWMETSRLARPLTARFIAGLTLEDAVRVATELKARWHARFARLPGRERNYLGGGSQGSRCVSRSDPRSVSVARYRFDEADCARTRHFGRGMPCELREAGPPCPAKSGSRVEMDMEDSSYTERNLKIVHEMHKKHPGGVRAVIQAYLYRSEADIHRLCDAGIPVRLCKGAYNEPASVAFPEKTDVDANYVKLMKVLFDRGTYPAIATHDDTMIAATLAYIQERGIRPDQFEFQMLLGVRRSCRSRSSATATGFGCMSPMAPPGIHTSCAVWRSVRPTCCSWREISSSDERAFVIMPKCPTS